MHSEFVAREEDPMRFKDSMPEPDISVMRGKLFDFDARLPTTAELVVEVAVSSVAPDRENAALYAENGVTQSWIVLGETEQVEVYRRPMNGGYQDRQTYGRHESIENVAVMNGPVPANAFFA